MRRYLLALPLWRCTRYCSKENCLRCAYTDPAGQVQADVLLPVGYLSPSLFLGFDYVRLMSITDITLRYVRLSFRVTDVPCPEQLNFVSSCSGMHYTFCFGWAESSIQGLDCHFSSHRPSLTLPTHLHQIVGRHSKGCCSIDALLRIWQQNGQNVEPYLQ